MQDDLTGCVQSEKLVVKWPLCPDNYDMMEKWSHDQYNLARLAPTSAHRF